MPVNDIVGSKASLSIPAGVPPSLIRDRQLVDRVASLEQRLMLASNYSSVPQALTALPSTPRNGQFVRLSVDNAGTYYGPYVWDAVYDTSLPAGYRWRIVGTSTPLLKYSNGGFLPFTGSSWQAAGSPQITTPFPGIYRWTGRMVSQSGTTLAQMVATITDPSAPAAGIGTAFSTGVAGYQRLTTLVGPADTASTVGVTRTVGYAHGGGSQTADVLEMYIQAQPLRLAG